MQIKSVDGIIRRPEHYRHHYHIRKFFSQLPCRGMITDKLAVLFVYDAKDHCKSLVCIEAMDDSEPGVTAKLGGMLDINSPFWADVIKEMEASNGTTKV